MEESGSDQTDFTWPYSAGTCFPDAGGFAFMIE